MTIKRMRKPNGYQGCRNCKYQPQPLCACDYLKGLKHIELVCRRWEKRSDDNDD